MQRANPSSSCADFCAIFGLLLAHTGAAQSLERLDPIVVTATRSEERAFELPLSIDSVELMQIQQDQLQINLSESLTRVPGLSIQNRWNYAQDLQVSSRGFGARAAFGVRGIRLYQDGIPATMPDGQGQTGSFSLASAKRIEVLRGPFSTLYGNAAGGVISIFTEDGSDPPQAQAQLIGGSYGTWHAIGKVGGEARGVNFVIADGHFHTDGYRDHSDASRDLFNAKLKFDAGTDTRIALIANTFYQPEAHDPLGLTRTQWQANPRQVDPAAIQFDTRKTVRQQQGGASLEQRLATDTMLRVTAYAGERSVRQYLALSGVGATSSGGVTDLDGDFGGVDARVSTRRTLAGGPLMLTAGAAFDRQHQGRRGFVNNNGALGDLRRDEDDFVSDRDAYAQMEWTPLPSVSTLFGVRHSNVRFVSDDHYVNSANPDDSGRVSYTHTSPVAGVLWRASSAVNAYLNCGVGFETPTFIELAYRPVGSGLNFALQPAVSRSTEAGIKFLSQQQRLNLAVFTIDTSNEIIVDSATGGRTTYKNASKTRRHGGEVEWSASFGAGFAASVSYTYLSARFAADATTGSPPQPLPAGSTLPGVPASSAYAELSWSRPEWLGASAALELQYADKLYVNELNSDAAPRYAVANVRAGMEQRIGAWTLREFIRVNNLTDRNYVGSVIVADTNGRFFEPAARRNSLAGVSVNARF